MEIVLSIGILIMGMIIGFAAGYFFGRMRAHPPVDLSQQLGTLTGISTQIAEMKGKFDEIERSRASLEKEKDRLYDEREHRIKEWMESTHNIFKEINEKSEKTAEEKEKRIESWMEATKRFFEEQKQSTEKFLESQGKSQQDVEKQRDAQLQDMKRMIEGFTRTVSGTKTRGIVGEEILREVLHNSIQAGVVATNLKTDSGEVEFAWRLDANKYIPIDAKLPDVFELVEKYDSSDKVDEQRIFKREIVEKIKKEIKNVQKYQNVSNTIDSCMLVVPPAVLEIAPEVIAVGKESGVFVCTYKDVFPIAHVLQEQYLRLKEEGDIGKYKQIVKTLFQILERISQKTETIKDAVTQIKNANDRIKEEIAIAKQQ